MLSNLGENLIAMLRHLVEALSISDREAEQWGNQEWRMLLAHELSRE